MHKDSFNFLDFLLNVSAMLLISLLGIGALAFIVSMLEKDALLEDIGHEEMTGFFGGLPPWIPSLWIWGWVAWLVVTLLAAALSYVTISVARQIAAFQAAQPPAVAPDTPKAPAA